LRDTMTDLAIAGLVKQAHNFIIISANFGLAVSRIGITSGFTAHWD